VHSLVSELSTNLYLTFPEQYKVVQIDLEVYNIPASNNLHEIHKRIFHITN